MLINMRLNNMLVIAMMLLVSTTSLALERNQNLDFDWKFQLGDHASYKDISFDDSKWRKLNVPHDWSIEGDYKEDNPSGQRGGWLPTGTGWYRKNIKFQPSWENKRVILRFDGVYLNSDVFVNGKHAGHRPNGYVSFEYDITKSLYHHRSGKPIKNNVIAVRVDHKLAPTGRWYTGSGIYRHVWLDVVDETHIPNDGVFVRTDTVDFSTNNAVLSIDTEIKGVKNANNLTLIQNLVDAKGNVAATQKTKIVASAKDTLNLSHSFGVVNAKLWSIESPYLYTLQTQVFAGKNKIDQLDTRVGIRTIGYNVKQGFLLNNKEIELKGMSMHHDAGPVGAAVPDDTWRFRFKQMKDMGMNALRPAHTPFAPFFYDLADEMGFVIMNEAFDGWETEKADYDYGLYFEQWWKIDLEAIVKRDRNHPSVVMWSIGNEVTDATAETQKKLVDYVKKFDATRPITQGRGYMFGHLDIDGFNGHGEYKGYLEEHFKAHPNTTQVGTEITHTLATRGIYKTKTWYRDKQRSQWRWDAIKDKVNYIDDFTEEEVFPDENPKYNSSYDNAIVRMSVRDEIKMANKLPYLLGTFRWTVFDYIGESFGWPARTRNFGIIDLAGFEKDPYYLYQSQWSEKPMVHMLPHWTHPGKEGVKIPVVVYTNLAEAELFLNGKSLGKKPMTDDMQIVWLVPYQAGELKVVATKGDITRTQVINTAGKAVSVKLMADRHSLEANETDVAHVTVDIVDSKGHFVPRALNEVQLSISGPGTILAADNGDILDITNRSALKRKVFNGKLMVFVKASDKKGEIKLTVSGKGLAAQTISIEAK